MVQYRKMASFQKRITANGDVRWRVRVRRDGYPIHTKTFRTKTDAKIWARDIESDLDKGKDIQTPQQKRFTLSEVINEYIDDYLPIKSNRKNNRELDRQLRWWEKELGKVALQNLM